MEWIRRRYRAGSFIYSACTGAILLAATGLLNGRAATSHWAYQELFRTRFSDIDFHPEPNLCFADPSGRIVTAGGTTSWHDLAIHIISRHCSPGEALRIAKVYLLKWHGEGQLPYISLVRRQPHADSVVRYAENGSPATSASRMPWQRSSRRPGSPNGAEAALQDRDRTTLIDYVQNLRIEEAKRLLEADFIVRRGDRRRGRLRERGVLPPPV